MKTLYKIFFGLFLILIAVNLYMVDWNLGFFNSENAKFMLPLAAGVLGTFFVIILNTLRKLSTSRK
ncbi:hypothetical protein [Halpernia sp. GG3]